MTARAALLALALIGAGASAQAWTLTWTPVTENSQRTSDCPLGCRDSLTGHVPLTSPISRYRVYRHRQSPTAVRLGAMLYANPDTFRVYWPTVRAEADYQWVVNVVAPPATIPDSLGTGYWWFVVPVKTNGGAVGCMSNLVWH